MPPTLVRHPMNTRFQHSAQHNPIHTPRIICEHQNQSTPTTNNEQITKQTTHQQTTTKQKTTPTTTPFTTTANNNKQTNAEIPTQKVPRFEQFIPLHLTSSFKMTKKGGLI